MVVIFGTSGSGIISLHSASAHMPWILKVLYSIHIVECSFSWLELKFLSETSGVWSILPHNSKPKAMRVILNISFPEKVTFHSWKWRQNEIKRRENMSVDEFNEEYLMKQLQQLQQLESENQTIYYIFTTVNDSQVLRS